MSSVREQILEAVRTVLVNASVCSGRVFRSRAEALARDETPAVVIKPGEERVDNSVRGGRMCRFNVVLEFHARGTPAETVADPAMVAAHRALMADETLGGLTRRLFDEGLAAPEYADGDETAGMFSITFTAVYATKSADITRAI